MSKLKRQRKQERIYAKIDKSIAECQRIVESHSAIEWKTNLPFVLELREFMSPESVTQIDMTNGYLDSINRSMNNLTSQIRIMLLQDYKLRHGGVPGSNKTKRLRKKREKMVFHG